MIFNKKENKIDVFTHNFKGILRSLNIAEHEIYYSNDIKEQYKLVFAYALTLKAEYVDFGVKLQRINNDIDFIVDGEVVTTFNYNEIFGTLKTEYALGLSFLFDSKAIEKRLAKANQTLKLVV